MLSTALIAKGLRHAKGSISLVSDQVAFRFILRSSSRADPGTGILFIILVRRPRLRHVFGDFVDSIVPFGTLRKVLLVRILPRSRIRFSCLNLVQQLSIERRLAVV